MSEENEQTTEARPQVAPECGEWNGLKAEDAVERVLLAHLRDHASESLAARIAAGKKTVRGAVAFVTEWARKNAGSGARAAMVSSEDVFGQVMHYFEEDELNAEEKAPSAKVELPSAKAAPPVGPGSAAAKKVRAQIKERREARKAGAKKDGRKAKAPKQLDMLSLLFGGPEK